METFSNLPVRVSAFLYFNFFMNVFRKKLEEDEFESRFEVDIGEDAASKVRTWKACLRGCPQINSDEAFNFKVIRSALPCL